MFAIARSSDARVTALSTPEHRMPTSTAGAGPSSAIASTIARNEPDTRRSRILSPINSLPHASTISIPSSESGCQSSDRLVSAAANRSTARSQPAATSRI